MTNPRYVSSGKQIGRFLNGVALALAFLFICNIQITEAAVTDGLVSFWGLNEASGTRSDSVGSNHLATTSGSVSDAIGKVASSSQFQSGSTGYLSIANNSSFNTSGGDFSISLWVYLANKTGTQVFVSKYSGTGYAVYYEPGTPGFMFTTYTGGSSGITAATSLGDPSTDTWYHITAVHDAAADTNTIRINDQYTNTKTSVSDQGDTAGPFSIGAFSNGAYVMNGRVDAVGLWNRKLTAGEITQLYNSGSGVELIATPDTTAPLISSIASSTNQTTATITWDTDETSSSTVSYGATTSYGNASSSSSLVTSHSVVLTDLTPATTYYYRVESSDYSGNLATSTALQFTTTASSTINPIGYWKLDETSSSSNAADEIGTNTGLQTGAPVASTTVPTVNFIDTGSRGFDGNNYFTINRPVQNDFTICAWIKTTSTGGGSNHWTSAPIMDSEWGGLANDFGFGIGNGGKLMFGNGGSYDSQVNGNTIVNDDVWHNVCVTRNNTSGAVKLYVDATLDASGTTSTGTLSINPYARIGYGYDGAAHYVGLIDDVRVYDTDLTSTQLLSLYQGNNDVSVAPTTTSGCSSITTTVGGLTYTTTCGVTTVTGVATPAPAFVSTQSTNTNTSSSTSTSTVAVSNATTTLASSTTPLIIKPVPTKPYQFPRNLKRGMTGTDVLKLQRFLNLNGFNVAVSGAGSPGKESFIFGIKTEAAVIKFQAKNSANILSPQNFTGPTGWFYEYSRAVANRMLVEGTVGL